MSVLARPRVWTESLPLLSLPSVAPTATKRERDEVEAAASHAAPPGLPPLVDQAMPHMPMPHVGMVPNLVPAHGLPPNLLPGAATALVAHEELGYAPPPILSPTISSAVRAGSQIRAQGCN